MSILFPSGTTGKIIDCGSPATIDDIFDGGGTISCWINAIDYGENNQGRLFQKNNLLFLLDTNSTIQLLIVFSGGNARWEMPANQMTGEFDKWHHIVVTYDADSTANDPLFCETNGFDFFFAQYPII